MSYLARATPKTEVRTAGDFDCGWSALTMLAGLSLKSGASALNKPVALERMQTPAHLPQDGTEMSRADSA